MEDETVGIKIVSEKTEGQYLARKHKRLYKDVFDVQFLWFGSTKRKLFLLTVDQVMCVFGAINCGELCIGTFAATKIWCIQLES